jgi:hypothetical protein
MEEQNKIVTVVELSTQQAQQELVKLNATVSNSTKSLEERIAAKNKAIEIQNQLSKKTIEALENERRTLEGSGASAKQLDAIFEKLNKAKLESVKINEQGRASIDKLTQAQEKQAQALKDSKDPIKNLDEASGGLLEKFKLFITNPIGIAITAIVALFNLFREAISRNEKATEGLNKILSKFTGFMNGVLAVVGKVAEFFIDKLLKAFEDPQQALSDFGKAVQENLINRVKAFLVIGEAVLDFFKGNFKKSLQGVTDGIVQMGTGITNASSKLEKLGKSATETYSKAASATERLANATKTLEKNQVLLEQSDLRSKKLAEDQRQIRDDTSKSFKERIAANNRLGSILDEQLKRELSIAKQSLSLEKQKQIAFGVSSETTASINAARTKILEIEERIGGQRSEQLVNQNSLLKEQADAAKTATAERLKKEEEASKASLEIKKRELEATIKLAETKVAEKKSKDPKADTLEAEKDILKKKEELELLSTNLLASEKLAIEQRYVQSSLELDLKQAEEKKRIADELYKSLQEKREIALEQEQELARIDFDSKNTTILEKAAFDKAQLEERTKLILENEKLTADERVRIKEESENQIALINKASETANKQTVDQQASDGINALAESFGIAREVAIAKMIMAAPEAIGNSFKNAAAAYAPPFSIAMGALGAATTVVPIIKGLADIKKTRFSGKSKKGGGNSGGSISASSAGSSVASVAIGDLANNNAAQLGVDQSIKGAATATAANSVLGSSGNQIVFSEGKYSDFKNQVTFKEQKTSI